MSLSLRARLLAGFALIVVVLVSVAAVIASTTRGRLLDQVDSRLASLARSTPDGDHGEASPDAGFPAPPDQHEPSERERVSDTYEGIIDAQGVKQDIFLPNFGNDDYGSPDIGVGDLPAGDVGYFTTSAIDANTTYRVLARRVGDITTLTAVPIDDVENTIRQLVLIEIIGSAAILATLGVVGWWVVHLGIRPIKEMTATASRIAGGDLGVRVEPGSPGTEAGQLAAALNQMLGQIEHAFDERAASEDRLRRFVADASHELRTPVTTIRGYAELYRQGGLSDPDALADAMRRTEQEAERMSRLVEDMLTLARLDEERPLASQPVDLVRVGADAARDTRVTNPGRPVTFDHDGIDTAVITGDDDRIRQAVINVVNNAVVHTEEGTPIAIEVTRDGERATIAIRDSGAGMAPEIVERVKERFFRADPARSRHRGGSGLGLSIVDATVAAMGGAVHIDSTVGEGTTVAISFPLADR